MIKNTKIHVLSKFSRHPTLLHSTYTSEREIRTPVGRDAGARWEAAAGVVVRWRPVVRHEHDNGVLQHVLFFQSLYHPTDGFVEFGNHRYTTKQTVRHVHFRNYRFISVSRRTIMIFSNPLKRTTIF